MQPKLLQAIAPNDPLIGPMQRQARGLRRQFEKAVQVGPDLYWGAYAWTEFAPHVSDLGVLKSLKAQIATSVGQPLKPFERDHLPMAHPLFASRHNRAHLSEGIPRHGLDRIRYTTLKQRYPTAAPDRYLLLAGSPRATAASRIF